MFIAFKEFFKGIIAKESNLYLSERDQPFFISSIRILCVIEAVGCMAKAICDAL